VRFLFDMRGFWADERVDGGLWDLAHPLFRAIYRHFKRKEAAFLAEADHIVSLTEEGKRVLLAREDRRPDGPPISVIPCCVDMDHFALPSPAERSAARAELGITPGRKVAVYLGSVGTWYMLPEMLDLFRTYRSAHPGALLFFVTQDDAAPILAAARERGLGPDDLLIRPASRAEVPRFVGAGDFGLFFIKPVFSKKASSPTKMGELLALGLPVLANGDVGDVDHIAAATGAGVTVDRFDDAAYREAIRRLDALDLSPDQIRQAALIWFDARTGVDRYDRIYRDPAVAATD
jgi:glycosyltransferase involved in cell wall biosynthesis